MTPVLYIFSGLPASGKTTLAQGLARHLKATYVRIDTIEQALRDLCGINVVAEGYRLSYRLAKDNLALGNTVIADSCNPIQITREEWEQVATNSGCQFVNIEVICSDPKEHRTRVEERTSTVPNLRLPTWQEIVSREYEPWTQKRIVIDTAHQKPETSLQELLGEISQAE